MPLSAKDPNAARVNIPICHALLRQVKAVAAMRSLPVYVFINQLLSAECARALAKNNQKDK